MKTLTQVTEIEQTCGACPSQWEGTLETGEKFYARFRHGYLSVVAAPTLNRAITASIHDTEARVLADKECDGDGVMSMEDMLRHANLTL